MDISDLKTNAFYELEKELYDSECTTPTVIRKRPNSQKGDLGCKDDCIDYPDCHPTCRARWYIK